MSNCDGDFKKIRFVSKKLDFCLKNWIFVQKFRQEIGFLSKNFVKKLDFVQKIGFGQKLDFCPEIGLLSKN